MLPEDYPDDFDHGTLREQWFTGIPWSIQSQVMAVNPRLRAVRNPVTQVFVVVLRLSPDDPKQVYRFFATDNLIGWAPIMETERGHPVEALRRVCEGMQRHAALFDEQYGQTQESIAAKVDRDAAEREAARVAEMRESTRFSREFASKFMRKSLAMSVSDAKGRRLYEGAAQEYLRELEHRRNGFSLVVPK